MAIVCAERMDSRQLTDAQSAELLYKITGTSDESAALSALKSTAPAVLYGLKRQPVTVEPVHVDTAHEDLERTHGAGRERGP